MESVGYLAIYLGGSRSGKSAAGLAKYMYYYNLRHLGFEPVILIKDFAMRSRDNSYDNYQAETLRIVLIQEEMPTLEQYNVVFIDECQFCPNLGQAVRRLLSQRKKVYLMGIDGDINGNPMGETLSLIPLADYVTKLTGLCLRCVEETHAGQRQITKPSIRTNRRDDQHPDNPVQIGGLEVYIPVCREHDNLVLGANP